MAPLDLSDLQRVVDNIATPQNLTAAGPLAITGLARTMVKSKVMTGAVAASGAWLVAHELSTSVLKVIGDTFGNLESLLSTFRM